MDDNLLTPAEAAERLNISLPTLKLWRTQKHGPPALRLSVRTIRYRREDIDAWAAMQLEDQ